MEKTSIEEEIESLISSLKTARKHYKQAQYDSGVLLNELRWIKKELNRFIEEIE